MQEEQTMCNHHRDWGSNNCRTCGKSLGPREDRLPEFYEDRPRPKFVGAYRVWLAYGGPEEGGWWSTLQEHLSSLMVRDDEDLRVLCRKLWDEYEEEDDGRRISDSNASGAVCIYFEKTPGQHERLSVGHYE
jgi:hypothetical protein